MHVLCIFCLPLRTEVLAYISIPLLIHITDLSWRHGSIILIMHEDNGNKIIAQICYLPITLDIINDMQQP